MKEAFKEGKGIQGGKMHSKREEAFCAGNCKKMHTYTSIHELWFIIRVSSGPPSAAPCLKRHLRREKVFKEVKGIQGGKRHSGREMTKKCTHRYTCLYLGLK